MTYAPKSITAAGAYWTSRGGVNLGIVGDAAHTVGYHLGRDRIYSSTGQGDDDYSVRHPRDKAGLSGAASALDLGRLNGKLPELYQFSRWLVAECQREAPGTDDIREVIYSPDGQKVQRYSGVDGLIHEGPGNGDSSHITHTHISYFRDSEERDKVAVFAAYWEGTDVGLEGGPVQPGQGIGEVTIKVGRGLVNLRTGAAVVPANATRTSFGRWRLAEPYGGDGIGRQSGYLVSLGAEGHIALDDVVDTFTPAEPPPPSTGPEVLTGDDGSEYRRQ